MANRTNKNSIVIPREMVRKKGVVILDLGEYKKFLKYEMEKEYIDEIVKEGLKEKKKGKTESLENFLKREYPKLYEDYKH
jgi:hypothetical protein